MMFSKNLQDNEVIVLKKSLMKTDDLSINSEREISFCYFSKNIAQYYYDNLIGSVWNVTIKSISELKYEEAFIFLLEVLNRDFSENPVNLKTLISFFLLSNLAYKIQNTLSDSQEKLKYIDIGLELLLKTYNNFGKNIYFKKKNVISLMVELVSLKKEIEMVQKSSSNQNLLSEVEMVTMNLSNDNKKIYKYSDFVEKFVNIVKKYEIEKNAEINTFKTALAEIREELRDSKYGIVCYVRRDEKEEVKHRIKRRGMDRLRDEQDEISRNIVGREDQIFKLKRSENVFYDVLTRQLATNYILSIVNNQKNNNIMINEVLVRYIEWQDFCPDDLELIGYFINILKSQELMAAINGRLIKDGLKNTLKNCSNATEFTVLLKLVSVEFTKIALKVMYERYRDLTKVKKLFNSNVVLDITYRIVRGYVLIKERLINGDEQQKEKIIKSAVSELHEEIKKYITDDHGWAGLVQDLLQDKDYSNDSQVERIKVVVNILNKMKEVTEEYNLIINELLEKYVDIDGDPKESIYKKS